MDKRKNRNYTCDKFFDQGADKSKEVRLVMKELVIIIKPEKLETVKEILDEYHCGGMTISSVMGCGAQRGMIEGTTNVIKGFKANINLLPKIQVSVVVEDQKAENLVLKICELVSTGVAGDGKIFVRNIEEAIRIRTGERGSKALSEED